MNLGPGITISFKRTHEDGRLYFATAHMREDDIKSEQFVSILDMYIGVAKRTLVEGMDKEARKPEEE